MATPATGQPPLEVGQWSNTASQPPQSITNPNPLQNYTQLLQPKALNTPMQTLAKLPLKTIEFLHGEPVINWKKQEVKQSIIQQGLQLAVLGKFHMKNMPSVNYARLSLMEDYVHLLSKHVFYLKAQGDMWQMRCTKWNPWWKPDENTPIAVAWIRFPELPPNFFGKECIFSLASAVGNPLHVNLATQNDTRPSCAKVKVEVNLLSKFSQRIKLVEEEDEFGLEEFKWIKIKYDYIPKYCSACNKQGHNELECSVIDPELHKTFEERVDDCDKDKELVGMTTNTTKVLTSGKVLGKSNANPTKQEWMQMRQNKYQRNRSGHIIDNSKEK
uniref:DUF4283 domain-containing protein n=1 Tax=Nicotiana tabacum TaxID=4097 RepID=A0A1S3YJR0_TOBAC|nr:PREDICTED: uncharacterized protein LOC107777024 [Nicotiana tabacum]